MPLSEEEEIVRAICTDKWDGQRISPSVFAGANTSVSRLTISPLADHWDLFRKGVEKPPERLLEEIAQINIGTLAEIGRSHSPATTITVEADPVSWNVAHAIIPQKLSRGLANRILQAVTIHSKPSE